MSATTEETKDGLHPVVLIVNSYKDQAAQAKQSRIDLNRLNYDCYHMRSDWSHKKKGQSKEFLAKQSVAVEQLVSFLQQGLIDKGNWFSVEKEAGVKEKTLTAHDIFLLLRRQLELNHYYTMTGDALKTAALSSLLIAKEHGRFVPKLTFRTKFGFDFKKGLHKKLLQDRRMVWQSKTDLIRYEDYYPDPTGSGLYEGHEVEMDLHDLLHEAETNADDYDIEMCRQLQASYVSDSRLEKARETGQDQVTSEAYRKRVTIMEMWGTLIDTNANVLHENCVCRVANGRFLISPPKSNPYWHQERPFVASAILRVPFSTVHRALMDAPTMHNKALNEVYNLMLDAGLQSVFGIRQIREGWLEDPSQVSDGIPAGTTLRVNQMCPPGMKAFERVDTGTEFQQAVTIFNITDKEFNTSAFTNDIRMGALPDRAVKATEIVSTNQVLAGVTSGIVKTIEDDWMSNLLRKKWLNSAQHLNDYSEDDVKALLGDDKAMQLANMHPEDIFAETAAGMKFKVFGLSTTLNKIQDFRHIGMLLQLLSASPDLMNAFAQKYDLTKLLGEIITSLDIDVDKIKRDDAPANPGAPALPTLQAVMGQLAQGQGAAAQGVPAQTGSGPGTKTLQNLPQPQSSKGGPQPNTRAILQGITTPGGPGG